MTRHSVFLALGSAICLFALSAGPVRAQDYYPRHRQPPPPGDDLEGIKQAGVRLSVAAMNLHYAAERMPGAPYNDRLLRDMVELRREVDEFRSAADLSPEPSRLQRRFGRVREAYERVQYGMSRLNPEDRSYLGRQADKVASVFDNLNRWLGR
jgi:hypothetical protein